MRFVIIGGDAAGMSAASRAKRNQPDMDVVVLEQTMDVSYSACGMPYNIADPRRDMDDLVVRQADVFRQKQGIDLRTGHRVTSIQPAEKVVFGKTHRNEDFELAYDNLLIATGASATKPDLPGMDLPGVLVLKSLEDGRVLKGVIGRTGVKKVILMGMGYIALEMVEALHARGIQAEMVKPRPELLPWMPPDMAAVVKEEVERHGVALHLGQAVTHVEKEEELLKVICTDRVLDGHILLVAVGVRPNSEIASQAGLELGPHRAIAVDRTLRTSAEHICAAGDCADAFHVVTGRRTWIPLALRANRAGYAVADNVTGRRVELDGVAGTAVFKVFDLQVARTGLSVEEAEEAGFEPVEAVIKGRARALPNPDSLWVQLVADRKTGILLGGQLVGREGAAHRVNALAVALHLKMTLETFSQCDLAYAPPFSPVWDPMLTAANQLLKKL
jgi:NADPH-dependent 2,4-dienoyl-CoA reductase/sulfur reductase-like enzyme